MNAKRCITHATCLFMLILALATALMPHSAFANEALGDADTPQAPKTTNNQAAPSGNEESRQAQSYYKHQLKMIGIDPILLGAEEIPLREVKDIPWFYTSKVPMLHLHLPKAEGAEKAVCKAVQDYFRE